MHCFIAGSRQLRPGRHISIIQWDQVNPQLTGRGAISPPLVFLRYLPKLRTDYRQIFNILQAINLTHPDKRKTR